MFDSTRPATHSIKERLEDAADLLIDFATLGEYGLEPVGRTRRGCAGPAAPRARARERRAACNLLVEAGFRRAPAPAP